MSHDDAQLYSAWMDLLTWMQDYATFSGLEYVKVSDFPDYIYRMERPYDLPTTTASASLNRAGQPLLIASVSPRHVDLKSVQLRLMGGSKHWHLHAGDSGLLEGKRPFTRQRLHALLDGAMQGASA
jgi:NADH-quinone oxidoreductase chain 15